MKKTNKLLVMIVSLLLSVTLFACNGPDSTPTESNTTSESSEIESKPDFEGYTLTIATKWIGSYGNSEVGESDLGDLWIDWRREFQNDYNVKIENVQLDNYAMFETIAPKLMSGEKVADFFVCQMFDVEKLRHAGLLRPWNDVSTINLEDWTTTISENNSYNGKMYMISYGIPALNTGVLVNLSMIDRLNLPDPFELVTEKKWTFDTMRSMAQAATIDNGDGVWDKSDQYGVGLWDNFIIGALKSNGVNLIEQVDGQMQYGLNNPDAIRVLDTIKAFHETDKSSYPRNTSTWSEYMDRFIDGQLLFVGIPSNMPDEYPQIRDMSDDYGYLPVPTLDEGVEYSYYQEYWTAGYAIPVNAPNPDLVGLVFESTKDIVQYSDEQFMDNLARGYRDHQPTLDVYEMLLQRPLNDFYLNQPAFVEMPVTITEIVWEPTLEPASTLETIRVKMENLIADYYLNDPDFE